MPKNKIYLVAYTKIRIKPVYQILILQGWVKLFSIQLNKNKLTDAVFFRQIIRKID